MKDTEKKGPKMCVLYALYYFLLVPYVGASIETILNGLAGKLQQQWAYLRQRHSVIDIHTSLEGCW